MAEGPSLSEISRSGRAVLRSLIFQEGPRDLEKMMLAVLIQQLEDGDDFGGGVHAGAPLRATTTTATTIVLKPFTRPIRPPASRRVPRAWPNTYHPAGERGFLQGTKVLDQGHTLAGRLFLVIDPLTR